MVHCGLLGVVSVALSAVTLLQGCGGGDGGGTTLPPTTTTQGTTTTSTTMPQWVPCGPNSKQCCNPHSAPPQTCPGSIKCYACGDGDACQCETWIPPPTPAPPPAPVDYTKLQVVSYNLFWWCVSNEYKTCKQYANGVGFQLIANVLKRAFKQPSPRIDLLGLQECEDVGKITAMIEHEKGRFAYFQGPPQDHGTSNGLAWDSQRYTKIGGGTASDGVVRIATDKYGDRFMYWVRLKEKGGTNPKTLFFVNTHGPLNGCGSDLGSNYIAGINAHKQPGDLFVMTGDFNCGPATAVIQMLARTFKLVATSGPLGGADHIFTDPNVPVLSEKAMDGRPSDHFLLEAVLNMDAATDDTQSVVA